MVPYKVSAMESPTCVHGWHSPANADMPRKLFCIRGQWNEELEAVMSAVNYQRQTRNQLKLL